MNTGIYNFSATWVNTGTIPYAGLYILEATSFPNMINPSGIVLRINGIVIDNGSWVDLGKAILVLPNIWTTLSGQTAEFQVQFTFVGAPPSLSITAGLSLTLFGAVSVQLRTLLVAVMALMIVGLASAWWISPEIRKDQPFNLTMLYLFVIIAGFTFILPAGT